MKMNGKAREFLSAAMASGCAVTVAHDAGATTVTGGQNGVPAGFGAESSTAYVLPVGTTEVIGTVFGESADYFEFQSLPVGTFTIDVTSSKLSAENFAVGGGAFDTMGNFIDGAESENGLPFSVTGTIPGDGAVVFGVGSRYGANFDAKLSTMSAIPEPEAWTLMMGGGLASGAMLRRKRRLTLKAAEAGA